VRLKRLPQGNNFTYDVDEGGFSDDNLFSTDQRGFKHLIQAEAAEFLQLSQVLLNATVATIEYSDLGVSVALTDGRVLTAEYAICTFSLGVLQNDDVRFEPPFPPWKAEAIQSMTMVRYVEVFGRPGREHTTIHSICRPHTPKSFFNSSINSGSTRR
jgi:polyamine oxidase